MTIQTDLGSGKAFRSIFSLTVNLDISYNLCKISIFILYFIYLYLHCYSFSLYLNGLMKYSGKRKLFQKMKVNDTLEICWTGEYTEQASLWHLLFLLQ